MSEKEYIEREAAVKRFTFATLDCLGMEPQIRASDAVKAIETIPAADVVEVVRCKDCRHRDPEDHKCDCGGMERQGCPFPVDDNYYCSYGERKGGNGKMKIGDLWRRKTDEELANSLLNIVSNGKCPAGRYEGDDDCATMKRCYDCWLDWLKQEVESDG